MATATEDDMEVSWPGSPGFDDNIELCCPYNVLEIAKGSSVEEAKEAAELAVMEYEDGKNKEWIVVMKVAAFAHIVHIQWGRNEAWKLYQEVSKKNAAFRFFDICREAHDVSERPRGGASSGTDKEDERPPLARRRVALKAGPAGGKKKGAATLVLTLTVPCCSS